MDYLAAAPWNINSPPHFKRCGTLLIKQAIQESASQGWEGRFALHSLPQAEDFYRKCGMIDLGTDSTYEDLRYFEMDAVQAQTFLSKYP